MISPLGLLGFKTKALDDLLTDREFWDSWREKLKPRMQEIFGVVFYAGAEAGRTITPAKVKELLPLDPNEINLAAERVITTYTDEWWRQFEQSTQDRMRDAIRRARIDGTGVEGVIKDIEPLFGIKRAERIAATETTRLYGLGAQATYAASGIEQWEWQTVEDFAVCKVCRELNKNRFPISVAFRPAHVSCRCFPRPVIDEAAPPPGLDPEPEPEPEVGAGFPANGFKTTKEVEAFMNNGQFEPTFFSFQGMPPEVANKVARRLHELATEWPDVQKQVVYVGTNRVVPENRKFYVARLRPRTYAHATHPRQGGMSMSLNPTYFGNDAKLRASIRRDIETGFHPMQADIEDYASIVTHEWGHLTDFYMQNRAGRVTAIPSGYQRSDGFGAVRTTFDTWRTAKITGRSVKRVSDYARQNALEQFAETFSAAYHGSPEMLRDPAVVAMRRMIESLNPAKRSWGIPADPQFYSEITDPVLREQVRAELYQLALDLDLQDFAERLAP